MKPYRFLPEADTEFQEQIRYYDEQAAGLGDKFIAQVEAAISHVREYPDSGAPVSRNLRKHVLRAFKHNLLYVNAPEEIIVIAVAPHRRRPRYWRRRLKQLR